MHAAGVRLFEYRGQKNPLPKPFIQLGAEKMLSVCVP
jgi:hypothetical protein